MKRDNTKDNQPELTSSQIVLDRETVENVVLLLLSLLEGRKYHRSDKEALITLIKSKLKS